MAQKAAKQQAARNTAILKRIHLVATLINILFILYRLLWRQASTTRGSLTMYMVATSPALAIELWLERIGRPTHGASGEVIRPGEDLEAKGLTEYLFDVLYWSWGTICCAGLFGSWGWWLWAAIPVYSVWLAYATFGSVRQGMAGLAGQGVESATAGGGGTTSNRQKKSEKRGGQKMQYR